MLRLVIPLSIDYRYTFAVFPAIIEKFCIFGVLIPDSRSSCAFFELHLRFKSPILVSYNLHIGLKNNQLKEKDDWTLRN